MSILLNKIKQKKHMRILQVSMQCICISQEQAFFTICFFVLSKAERK